MTIDSTKIFGCPMCGFRVNEGDTSCPRCGNQFSTETKFECPFCGELVDQGTAECPSCHVNYGEFKESSEARGGDETIDALLLEIIQLEAQSAKASQKRFSCPGCSWMVEDDSEQCPRCGRSLMSEEEALQCPICGSAVSADAPSCPECGSSFEVEEPPRMVGRSRIHETGPEEVRPEDAEEEVPAESISEREEAGRPKAYEPAETVATEPQTPERGAGHADDEPVAADVPEEMPEAPSSEEPTKAVLPTRALQKPIRKPMPAARTEPPAAGREGQESEAEPGPDEDEAEATQKKMKQRKLKTRKLKTA